jgi:RNA-directed DNA polymerase
VRGDAGGDGHGECFAWQRQGAAADVFTAGNSYLGLLRQASHSHADRADLANVLRWRGHTVKGDLTKIYRRKMT